MDNESDDSFWAVLPQSPAADARLNRMIRRGRGVVLSDGHTGPDEVRAELLTLAARHRATAVDDDDLAAADAWRVRIEQVDDVTLWADYVASRWRPTTS